MLLEVALGCWLGKSETPERPTGSSYYMSNIGALIIRVGFVGPLIIRIGFPLKGYYKGSIRVLSYRGLNNSIRVAQYTIITGRNPQNTPGSLLRPLYCCNDIAILLVSQVKFQSNRTWEFPKIGGTLFWGPYNRDPTI